MVTLQQAFRSALMVIGLVFLSAGPLHAAPPPVPANFNAASPLVGTVEVTWNDVANETEYVLRYGPSSITTDIPLLANTTSHTINLACCISWHFVIRACNADGCVDSGVVGQTPDGSTGLPPVPPNFMLASTHAGTDVATWDDVFNETSYEFLWGPFPPGPTMPRVLPANTWFANFPGLGPGISYHFKIRACNAAGCSDYTEVVGQTPDGSNECKLAQQAWHATGTATISYVLGARVPTTWKVWAVGSFGVVQALSFPLPAFSPVATGDISFAFPSLGVVGFLTALTTPSGGLRCTDFDKVNTGP